MDWCPACIRPRWSGRRRRGLSPVDRGRFAGRPSYPAVTVEVRAIRIGGGNVAVTQAKEKPVRAREHETVAAEAVSQLDDIREIDPTTHQGRRVLEKVSPSRLAPPGKRVAVGRTTGQARAFIWMIAGALGGRAGDEVERRN